MIKQENERLVALATSLGEVAGGLSTAQEANEVEFIDAITSCYMILEGVRCEQEFNAKPEAVAKAQAVQDLLLKDLTIAKSARDIERKVVVFGPAQAGKASLLRALGGVTKDKSSGGDGLDATRVEVTYKLVRGINFCFWNVEGDFREVSEADRAKFCRMVDAFVFVCDSSKEQQELLAYRQPIQDWLNSGAKMQGRFLKNAPLCVIATRGDVGGLTVEDVNEGLGLYNLWTRHWNTVIAPQHAEEALPWLSTQLDDGGQQQLTANFCLASVERQARLVGQLRELLPKLADQQLQGAVPSLSGPPKAASIVAEEAGPPKRTRPDPVPKLPEIDQRPKFGTGREPIDGSGFYEGGFRYWRRDGHGVLLDKVRSEVYEGQFRDERYHGQGTKWWADGSNYAGTWFNGKKHMEGVMTSADGRVYEGEWLEGKRHGKGKQVFENNDVYLGSWRDGAQHGRGTYYFADRGVFEGNWCRGAYHGEGRLMVPGHPVEHVTYTNGVLTSWRTVEDGEATRVGMHETVKYPKLAPSPYRISATTRAA